MPRMRLQGQLLVLSLGLALLPLLAVGLVIDLQGEVAIRQNESRRLMEASADIVESLESLVADHSRDIQALAANPLLARSDIDRSSYLRSLLSIYPSYRWIAVIDRSGKIVAATDDASIGRDVSAEPWFPRTLGSTTPVIEDVHRSLETGQVRVLSFHQAMRDSAGLPTGAVSLRLDFKAVEEWLASHPLSQEGDIDLLAPDGRVLIEGVRRSATPAARPEVVPSPPTSDSEAVEADWGNLSFVRALGPGERTVVMRKNEYGRESVLGVARGSSSAEHPGLDWIVVVDRPAEEVFGVITEMRANIVAAGLLAAFFAALASVLLSRSIARPIREMTRAAEGIARGEVDQQITVKRRDELGDLAAVFNRMIAYLRDMAGAAQQLGRGNLAVAIEPRGEADALGNTFRYQLVEYLRHMAGTADAIARGNLSVEVEPRSSEDALGHSFRAMISELRQLLSQVDQVVGVLNAAASQLTAISTQQAGGAQEQAAAVAQVSATMEELSRTARQIADSAADTLRASEQGQSAIRSVAEAMAQTRDRVEAVAQRIVALGEQSQRIGEITEIIGEIANKTHLLALNAAIEAAAAGEYGRRFAVVASQVKELARETRSATTQVKQLIAEAQAAASATVLATEQASRESERSAALAHDVSQAIDATVERVHAISLATQQQQSASDQVVVTLRDIATVARQAAEGSREIVEGARRLSDSGQQLRSAVARFTTA